MLYEVVIIERPTKKETEDGALEKILVPLHMVVAPSDDSAQLKAVMANKDKLTGDSARMEVLIRPFA